MSNHIKIVIIMGLFLFISGAGPLIAAEPDPFADPELEDALSSDPEVLNEALGANEEWDPLAEPDALMEEGTGDVTQEAEAEGIQARKPDAPEAPVSEDEMMFRDADTQAEKKEMTREQIQKDVEALFEEGKKYYEQQEYEGAAEIWERILVNYPTAQGLYEIRYALANAYEFSRQYDKAITQYQRVLAERPKADFAKEAAYRLGGCYERVGEWRFATEVYKDLVRKGPREKDSIRGYFNIAMLYLKQRNFKRAETIYKNIIKYFPGTSDEIQARLNLASLYAQSHRYRNAVREYKLIQHKFPDTDWAPIAAMHIGDTYKLSGNLKKAREAYTRVLYDYYNRDAYVAQAEEQIRSLKHHRELEYKVYEQ
ncbi:MAG: tetratricopeptide repeat protein [Candidatus Goldiibacteriota bacterium]